MNDPVSENFNSTIDRRFKQYYERIHQCHAFLESLALLCVYVRFVPMVKHIMQECCHFQWTSSALSNVTFTFDF